MKNKPITQKLTIFTTLILFIFPVLACSSDLLTAENAQAGIATAQAAAQNASAYATQAAPTIQALATQASILATQSAPSIEAGKEILATAAANAQATGADVQATLQAAGIDGQYLAQKASSLRPDENGNVNMTITETELNLVLQSGTLFGEQNENTAALQATSARMTSGTIIISGQTKTPVQGLLTIVFQPIVINNQLQFQIVSASLDNTTLPEAIINTAQSTLDGTLNGAIGSMPGNVIIKNVFVSEGFMTLTAGSQ